MKTTKILISAAMLALALSVFVPTSLHANEIFVTVNNEQINFADQRPVIIDGRTLVPIRGVFEALGFDVDWHQEAQTVTLINTPYIVVITVGSPVFTTNGEEFELDVPAQIINGRTMLPIRAVVESLGMAVMWNQASDTVSSVAIHTLSFFAAQDLLGTWNALRFSEHIDGEPTMQVEFDGDTAVRLELFADGTAIFSETGQPDITARWFLEDGLLHFTDAGDGTEDSTFNVGIWGGQLELFHRQIDRDRWVFTDIGWSFEPEYIETTHIEHHEGGHFKND